MQKVQKPPRQVDIIHRSTLAACNVELGFVSHRELRLQSCLGAALCHGMRYPTAHNQWAPLQPAASGPAVRRKSRCGFAMEGGSSSLQHNWIRPACIRARGFRPGWCGSPDPRTRRAAKRTLKAKALTTSDCQAFAVYAPVQTAVGQARMVLQTRANADQRAYCRNNVRPLERPSLRRSPYSKPKTRHQSPTRIVNTLTHMDKVLSCLAHS